MRGVLVQCIILACASLVCADQFYTLDILNNEVAPDGFPRQAVTVNGKSPGPILSATVGEDFYVTVNNLLTDSSMNLTTSIHWHGIFQPRTAYDDGPAFVTQCPIASSDTYQYRVETSNQTGTYWYHSHLTSQYIDGLRGALIIRDPENDPHRDLYDVDDDSTVITLNDWYHQPSQVLLHQWQNQVQLPEPVPDSNLFNGVGRYNNPNDPPLFIPDRPVIRVQKGLRYRFRLINMSATVMYNFGIQGHNLTIIEVDGVPHEAHTVTSVSLGAGQRYSVVVNADGEEDGNYWIAYPGTFNAVSKPTYNLTEAFAILRYDQAEEVEPTGTFTPDNTGALKEYELRSLLLFEPPESGLILQVNMTFDFDFITNRFRLNGRTYSPPSVPTLYEILHSNKTDQTDFGDEDVYVVPHDVIVELRIAGFPNHPFHLHGHTFQVVQSAEGPPNYDNNAPIRDTVQTNGAALNDTNPGPVTIRFRTDNPGPWFLHCHKDWHLESGLAAIFAEDPEGMRDTIHPPSSWEELCDIYNQLPPDEH